MAIGALGVAHVDDAEADERLWALSAGQPAAAVGTTWASSVTAGMLTSYTGQAALAQTHMVGFRADTPTAVVSLARLEAMVPTVDNLTTTSGRAVVKPISWFFDAVSPARYWGHGRQMGIGPDRVNRTIAQDSLGADQAYVISPSESTAYDSLYVLQSQI